MSNNATQEPDQPTPLPLFDAVVKVLEERFVDQTWRSEILPTLAASLRPPTDAPPGGDLHYQAVKLLLAQAPTSHVSLLSRYTVSALAADLNGKPRPTFGLDLVRVGAQFFAANIWRGSSADEAGVQYGDEVVLINGKPVEQSLASEGRPNGLVDWDSSDANARADTPHGHLLRVPVSQTVTLTTRKSPDGPTTEIALRAKACSALEHAERATRLIDAVGTVYKGRPATVAYAALPFAFVQGTDGICDKWIELIRSSMADSGGSGGESVETVAPAVRGAIFDLRGRGGVDGARMSVLRAVEKVQREFGLPVVALIDAATRSQKEVIAHELRTKLGVPLIGAPTAGAVIPLSLADVGHNAILMYPSFDLASLRALDMQGGVPPDVSVEPAGAYANGADPILSAAISHVCQLPMRAPEPPVEKAAPDEGGVSPPPMIDWVRLSALQLERFEARRRLRRQLALTGITKGASDTIGEPHGVAAQTELSSDSASAHPPISTVTLRGELALDSYTERGSVSLLYDEEVGRYVVDHQIGSMRYRLDVWPHRATELTTSGGLRDLTGAALELVRALSSPNGPFEPGLFAAREVIEATVWDGRAAYVVRAKTLAGVSVDYVVDAQTTRTIGRISQQPYLGTNVRVVERLTYGPAASGSAEGEVLREYVLESPMTTKRMRFT